MDLNVDALRLLCLEGRGVRHCEVAWPRLGRADMVARKLSCGSTPLLPVSVYKGFRELGWEVAIEGAEERGVHRYDMNGTRTHSRRHSSDTYMELVMLVYVGLDSKEIHLILMT